MNEFVIQLNGYLRIVNEVGFFDGGPQGNIAIWQPGKLEEMRLNLIREGRLRPEAELDGTRLCVQIILPDIELEM